MANKKWTCDFCGERALWQSLVDVFVPGEGRTVGALGCQKCADKRGFASFVISNYVGPRAAPSDTQRSRTTRRARKVSR